MAATRRRVAVRVALVAAGFVAGSLVGELVATGYALLRFGTASVVELHDLEQGNVATAGGADPYQATLIPHPFLGFVHDRDHGVATLGAAGLFGGRPMPLERDPDSFTILVLGGSAAAQFAQVSGDGERPLEELLAERYDFDGRRVVVLNGADGGWKQPQQLIMLSLYGEAVDAVISIEGFNEFHSLTGHRLEYPADYVRVSPRAGDPEHEYARSAIAAAMFDASRDNAWIGSSRLLYFATKALRAGLLAAYEAPQVRAELTVESIFALPEAWDEMRRVHYNLGLYEKYLRLTDRVAAELGLKRAFFFQPVPATGKTLTADEREAAASHGTGYGPAYRRMVDRLLALREDGVPAFSLLDAFTDETRSIYADAAHCRTDLPRNGSTGYRIMAERIAEVLEGEWGLRRRR